MLTLFSFNLIKQPTNRYTKKYHSAYKVSQIHRILHVQLMNFSDSFISVYFYILMEKFCSTKPVVDSKVNE